MVGTNRQEEVKNSVGNAEAKELIFTTHGHELREGMLVGGVVQGGGEQRGLNMDNCNSIINKTYLNK